MKQAFTLVELLIVVAILAVLSVVVFVVVNPSQRLADANNIVVKTDVQTVYKSLELFAVDNRGSFPALDSGDELIADYSSTLLPSATNCSENSEGASITTAPLADFVTESNDFVPDYISQQAADTLTNLVVYYYSPASQIIVCSILADGSTYVYPEAYNAAAEEGGSSNLVADGDMEAANTSAWLPHESVQGNVSKETNSPHGGSQVLRLTGGSSYNRRYQIIPQGEYTVTGYARSDGHSTNPSRPILQLRNDNAPSDAPVSVWYGANNTTGWQSFSVTFTNNFSPGRLTFSMSDAIYATGYVEYDDVVVTEVP